MPKPRFTKTDDTTSFRDHDSYLVDRDNFRILRDCNGDRITTFGDNVTDDDIFFFLQGLAHGEKTGRAIGEAAAQQRIRNALGLTE
jgi:hypothetical protein